jgi:hypothetical protein
MDAILQKFAGKIDAHSIVKTVEEIRVEYVDDGLTKEDIPPILARLMKESVKFKKLPGPQKKKLVIAILNHLIEQIDDGEKDSEFEIVLKSIVPPMVDSFAAMLKAKEACLPCLK